MWELDHKEAWGQKNWCFQDSLESLGQKGDQINQSLRKSTLNTHWKESPNALTTWCKEPSYWKKPWCWERLRAGGEGGDRESESWMTSPTQWVDMNLSKLWEIMKGREAWHAVVHGVARSQIWLRDWTTTECKGYQAYQHFFVNYQLSFGRLSGLGHCGQILLFVLNVPCLASWDNPSNKFPKIW